MVETFPSRGEQGLVSILVIQRAVTTDVVQIDLVSL